MSTPGTTSPDGHEVTVTVDEGATWRATAVCSGCTWEAQGGTSGVESLAGYHEQGTDGSR